MNDETNALRKSSEADLAASELAKPGVDMGQDLVPQTFLIHVPGFVAGSTLDVKIQESNDNITFTDYLVHPQIVAKGQYRITGKSNARYRRAHLTVAGAGANFGKVMIVPVPGGEYTSW